MRKLVLEWLPQAQDAVIMGSDHSLATTHAAEIAATLATFLRRHKMPPRNWYESATHERPLSQCTLARILHRFAVDHGFACPAESALILP